MPQERRHAEPIGDRGARNRHGENVSGDDFGDLVRNALSHLYDPAYLQTHPLGRLADLGAGDHRLGQALRKCLLDGIESLRHGCESTYRSSKSRSHK